MRHLEYKSVSDAAYTITMHCPHRSNALNTVALQLSSAASRGNYKDKGNKSDAAPEEYLLHVYDTSLGVGNSVLVKQYLMEPDVDVSKITTAMRGDILTITLPRRPRRPIENRNRNISVPLPQVNDTILPEPEPEVEVEVVDPETEGVEVIDEGVVHESHYKRRDAWRGYMAYGSFHYY